MPPKKRYQWNPSGDAAAEERPSRSQKKRDSTALQRMGEELSALSPSVLEGMPLTPNLLQALIAWQRTPSHEGRRRQMQFVGRLMREEADIAAIQEALDTLKLGYAGENARFKQAEVLRETLMDASDDEMNTLLIAFSDADALRELVHKARNEREHGRPPHAFRALFRALRASLDAAAADAVPHA